MAIPNTTFRAYVEKLGATEAATFIGNEGDLFYDPNTASLRVSDGTTPGGLPVTGVTTVSGPIQQSLIPDADATYDLGSPTNQWRDLYLTNNTMYLGGTQVAISTAGKLAVDGEDLATSSDLTEEANQRLIVNTDKRVYSQGAPAQANPNQGGGWYYQSNGEDYIRWNFWTPKPNGDGVVGRLSNLQSGWCLFTPWTANTTYPYIQFYTLPKLGLGNAETWYRSRLTYTRPDDTHVVGEPVLLYFGENPTDVYPGVPRREMTLTSQDGPADADEFIYSSFVATSTSLTAGEIDFSTIGVGFRYSGTNYSYGLYAVPEPTKEYDGQFDYLGVGTVTSSLIPDANSTRDLGTAEKKWRDLYLSDSTIYLGDTPVAIDSGSLSVDGKALATTEEVEQIAVADANDARLIVNTDRKVYGEYAPGKINPNPNSGGWYYRTVGGSICRWNFFSPKPNGDGPVGQLGALESGWCLFTPWTTDTEYPYLQFYTTPKLGGGNAASWFRSKVTYVRAPEPQTPGTPVLLYFGVDPVDVAPGVPRRELTLDPGVNTEGPQDADEVIFASYLTHSTGQPDDHVNFSTTTVGFQYAGKAFKYGLYAVPETEGVTGTTIVDGKVFTIANGIIVDIT